MRAPEGEKPCVIIIDLATIQGLQAARILTRRGIRVLAMTDEPKHFCCRTRVCEEIIVTESRGEGFVRELERRAGAFRTPPVLLPCHDAAVRQLSRQRERLQGNYRFLLPQAEAVERLMDKTRFYRMATDHGGVVPKTLVVHDAEEFERAVATLTFPCVVKPPGRSRTWSEHSAHKAYKVDNVAELRRLYAQCRNWGSALLLQEWIPGSDADLFSCNVYFDSASNPLVAFVARKLRQWPPETGESSLGQECRDDLVLAETLRFFKSIGFCGLGYLELKRDPSSGRLVIIEANIGRPTGRSAIAEAGGVELLQTMYCDLSGLPLPLSRRQQYTEVKWIHLTRDFASAFHYWRQGSLTLADWGRSLRGKKVFAVLSWRDPAPFAGDLARSLRFLFSRKERHRRRGLDLLAMTTASAPRTGPDAPTIEIPGAVGERGE